MFSVGIAAMRVFMAVGPMSGKFNAIDCLPPVTVDVPSDVLIFLVRVNFPSF